MFAQSSNSPDITGDWIGRYPGHFDELVHISRGEHWIEAVKITGDDYVPAGEITWRARADTLVGEGQVAAHEFHQARFVPGQLEIVSPDSIVFHWINVGSVEFRRDD